MFDGRLLKSRNDLFENEGDHSKKEAKWRPKMMMVMAAWTNSVLESFENGSKNLLSTSWPQDPSELPPGSAIIRREMIVIEMRATMEVVRQKDKFAKK